MSADPYQTVKTEVEAEVEQAVSEVADKAEAAEPVDVSQTVSDESIQQMIKAELATLTPTLEAAAVSAVKSHLPAAASNAQVTVTSKTADAKSRAWRTLVQNLAFDVLVAIIALLPMLVNMNFTDKYAWIALGTTVLKTVFAVIASYVTRIFVDPKTTTSVGDVNAN